MIHLLIEGVDVGPLMSMEGDEPFVAQVAETLDAQQVLRKHVTDVVVRPMRLTFGAGMKPALYQWLTDWFKRLHPSKDGAIVFADSQSNVSRRIDFFTAFIVRVEIPSMSGGSPATGTFAITLQASRVRTVVPPVGTKLPLALTRLKSWSTSNFRVAIQNLQAPAITRIDAITVEQAVTVDITGREPAKSFAPLRIPNLTMWLPEARAGDVMPWYEDFMIAGRRGDADERSGSIDLLMPNLRDVLFTISLAHLGIVRIDRVRTADGGTNQLAVQIYCEEMGFVAAP